MICSCLTICSGSSLTDSLIPTLSFLCGSQLQLVQRLSMRIIIWSFVLVPRLNCANANCQSNNCKYLSTISPTSNAVMISRPIQTHLRVTFRFYQITQYEDFALIRFRNYSSCTLVEYSTSRRQSFIESDDSAIWHDPDRLILF